MMTQQDESTQPESAETTPTRVVSAGEVRFAYRRFGIGTDGLFRRHDYDVEISGNVTGAHYISAYKDVSGMMVPTKHRIYPRQQDNTPILDLLLVSINPSDIRFDEAR